MKSRKTAYVMLPLVLAIWGTIGWKVYASLGNEPAAVTAERTAPVKDRSVQLPDTIRLIANYRDPFLDKLVATEKPTVKPIRNPKPAQPGTPQVSQPVQVWPQVTYHGLIKRSGDEKTVGFLRVNGTSHFIRGNEAAGVVNVVRLWKDSVEVAWGKEKKIVRK